MMNRATFALNRLEKITSRIKDIINEHKLNKTCKPNLNLVITENPGTGKTTVARLIAEIFREEGLLESGHMVEVSRKDLVAEYVEQTVIRTAEKIADAMGGILFVDGAYQLSEGWENDFGLEAIETIIKAMSDHMGEFSVVITGYPSRIDKFIESNPDLHRRFRKVWKCG